MGASASQEAFAGLGVALLCLGHSSASEASNASAAVASGATGAGQQWVTECWQGGYTPDLCCRADPLLNCWDAVYTLNRCCPWQAVPPLLESPAPQLEQPASKEVPTPTAPAASEGDASCWGSGYTFARCCSVPAIVATIDGCWDPVFTEARCCRRAASGTGVSAAVRSPREAPVTASSEVTTTTAPTKAPGTLADAPGEVPSDELAMVAAEDEEDTASQAEFLRREGVRRWPKYFKRAHQLLDAVLMSADVATGASGEPDAVQVYHNLYEVVNQVVGGVQLASEAGRGLRPAKDGQADQANQADQADQADQAPDTPGLGRGAAALRAAFLTAATVLARLAQASQGTPMEHEEFVMQASAAVALSCRQQDNALFSEDMARRIRWLQQSKGLRLAPWRTELLDTLQKRINGSREGSGMSAVFERSWHMYAEDLAEAVWRPAAGHAAEGELKHADQSTLNPLSERLLRTAHNEGNMWQLFTTYVMAKPLRKLFSHSGSGTSCTACEELSRIVLAKYTEFEHNMRNESAPTRAVRQDEVNNAFFGWQLTHESEQEDERGADLWPELYRDSEHFVELKNIAKLACLEYLQQIYDVPLSATEIAQLELSIWASVTPPSALERDDAGPMGLAFHDHPLALLSGVFYAQAGGKRAAERTPTVFADPRGTASFHYMRERRRGRRRGRKRARSGKVDPQETLEPTAPFHRLAYAHAYEGLALVFPSWLVHGVPPHEGSSTRVTFAFNLHTLQGTTLSSWAKTTL